MNQTRRAEPREVWLLVATLLIAVSGLIYELIAATLSSYLLGDSIRQFSIVIGVFLSSMGLGAWVSKYVHDAVFGFVAAQILLGLVGGFLAVLLYFTYAFMGVVELPLYIALVIIGMLSGMEIPLIARILKANGAQEFRFENVLTVDYIGALVASVSFPILIIPHLNLMAASLVFGCLNLAVAGLSIWMFRDQLGGKIRLVWAGALLVSIAGLVQSERLISVVETNLFEDDIILSEATPYQQITITRFEDRTRLFLNHSIQFDTLDEFRYHESLVHPVMSLAPRRENILVLGGGDGMATREILKYRDVKSVTLVDLDPRVTELFSQHPDLVPLNLSSLNDRRVNIVTRDAWNFIAETRAVYDVIIIDLPDPKSVALSKLYSTEFYAILVERLAAAGVLVTQAGSPTFSRYAFWSVAHTLDQTRNPSHPGTSLEVLPYHIYVPSFGDWGFVMASPALTLDRAVEFPEGLKFLEPSTWRASQSFGLDVAEVDSEINSIQSHALVGYYNDGWDYWFR